MQAHAETRNLIELETRFWNSMVENDTDAALALLDQPALMVSAHGAMKFDHDSYRKMAEQGAMVLKSYDLSDVKVMFPTDDLAVLTYKVRQTTAMRKDQKESTQTMADSSTWVKKDGAWKCVMHTETAVGG